MDARTYFSFLMMIIVVWRCTQNMELTVSQAFNHSAEIAAAADYPTLRLFTVGQEYSDTSRGPSTCKTGSCRASRASY